MEYLFEKDGKTKEKYISGTNIIPYCQDDFKKMMKDIGEEDVEWSKNVSSAICQIAYNFMQELTARPTSSTEQFQNPYDAFNHIERNIRIKFPQLSKQAQTLSSEFISNWRTEDEDKVNRSSEKQKFGQKIDLGQQKPNKKKGRNKQNKYKLRQKIVQNDSGQSELNVLDNEDIQKLLDYLSEEEYSES